MNFENKNPIFGADGIPFLASSFADSKKLYVAQKPVLDSMAVGTLVLLIAGHYRQAAGPDVADKHPLVRPGLAARAHPSW